MKKILSLIMVGVLVLSINACKPAELSKKNYSEVNKPQQFTFFAFDTNCYINFYGLTDKEEYKAVCNDVINIVNGYDSQLSRTKEGSDLYEINHRTTDSVMITDFTATLFEIAKGFYSWTGGKFDISAGTLIELWDVNNRTTLPSEEEINEAKKHCGNFNYTIEKDVEPELLRSNKITFNGDKKTVYDLGALGKGFCCNALRDMINERGIKASIINLGGNVCCTGKLEERDKGTFNIAIYKPFTTNETIETVKVLDRCVITSGNYQRYFKIDGDDRIYHHIIDPKTGYPTNNELNSVTIISKNGIMGDFLSTACMLLGTDDSKQLIRYCTKQFDDKNIQAIFVDKNNNVTKYPKDVKTY